MLTHDIDGAAVVAQHLSRDYAVPGQSHTPVRALHDISVRIDAARMVAVVGASGSGKSTLLHCLAGLDRPTGGSVHLLGKQTTSLRQGPLAEFRARHVGFVFQEYNLVSALTAAENVALPGELAGRPLSPAAVASALDRVGLVHRSRQLPHQLSGGERQRVAVARVMACRPELVFADEPTGALDPDSGRVVLEWLRELARSGSTVVLVTHDVGAAAVADDVLVMHAGRLARRIGGGDDAAVADALAGVRHSGVAVAS